MVRFYPFLFFSVNWCFLCSPPCPLTVLSPEDRYFIRVPRRGSVTPVKSERLKLLIFFPRCFVFDKAGIRQLRRSTRIRWQQLWLRRTAGLRGLRWRWAGPVFLLTGIRWPAGIPGPAGIGIAPGISVHRRRILTGRSRNAGIWSTNRRLRPRLRPAAGSFQIIAPVDGHVKLRQCRLSKGEMVDVRAPLHLILHLGKL